MIEKQRKNLSTSCIPKGNEKLSDMIRITHKFQGLKTCQR